MRLFIAEKPSLGRAIADGLGGGRQGNGCIVCGEDTVTWCFGHLLELAAPEVYDPVWKQWRRDTLPMVPQVWKHSPREKAAAQLKVIGTLLRQASSAVNAGDPDREGQLLVDEVLEHFGFRGHVQRVWLASLDARSVAKALASLTDNARHAPLRDAARARGQADWLVGLNATRAMTLLGRDAGREGILSLGRVQTPTLNLVVTRDREISAFKAVDYLVLQARFEHAAGPFMATLQLTDDMSGQLSGLDSQGRLVDAVLADSLARATRGAAGSVATVVREKKQKAAPLPHCLSSLQKAASSRWGMTAQQVLDTAQKLYEQKLTTYPRSDCRYLPVEQFEDAGRILSTLASVPGLEGIASNADAKLKSAAWDTAKVTAHHAIIPTGEVPGNLSVAERNLYMMIATAYCAQFYPPLRYESQKIVVAVANTRWEARGRLILEPGWTRCTAEEEDAKADKDKADQALPAVAEGDDVRCSDVATLKKKTTPPPRFTEGSLIEAMANVHRFVTDAAAKATLRENEGIGTEATRAGIIEALKGRHYLKADGKALVSTALAGQVMDLTPHSLKDPATTAQWESKLEAVAQGTFTLEAFMADQVQILPALLAPLLTTQTGTAQNAGSLQPAGPVHPCPVCGKPLQKRKGDRGAYWSCLRKEAHSDGNPVFLPDDRGRPGQRREAPQISTYRCPRCGKALIRRQGTSKKTGKPYDFFACSGLSAGCKETFDVVNDTPLFKE